MNVEKARKKTLQLDPLGRLQHKEGQLSTLENSICCVLSSVSTSPRRNSSFAKTDKNESPQVLFKKNSFFCSLNDLFYWHQNLTCLATSWYSSEQNVSSLMDLLLWWGVSENIKLNISWYFYIKINWIMN